MESLRRLRAPVARAARRGGPLRIPRDDKTHTHTPQERKAGLSPGGWGWGYRQEETAEGVVSRSTKGPWHRRPQWVPGS